MIIDSILLILQKIDPSVYNLFGPTSPLIFAILNFQSFACNHLPSVLVCSQIFGG
jgi:hypothetical protein